MSDPRSLLQLALAETERWLDELPDRPVGPRVGVDALRAAFDRPFPEEGETGEQVLRDLIAAARPGLMASPGPRFFGYVIGGTYPVALAADWLTTAWDQNSGLYSAAPAAAVCEEVAARWTLESLGLPPDCGVGFVTGGQMANTTGLLAARHAVLRQAGWNVEEEGLQGAPRVHVVVAEEGHATIDVALRMVGLGRKTAIRVASDAEGRMRADSLRDALAPLEGPIVVCAQAGNVNSGSFDPLGEIVEATHAKGGWVHVDGAFGLWALAAPSKRHLAEGALGADSWATDAHKWLNVPYDSGIVIVRDRSAHFGATSVKASYLIQAAGEGAPRDQLDWTPEFSRRARGFALWATLLHLGRAGLAELVERNSRQAVRIARRLREHSGVTIENEVVLNQVLVDFEPPPGIEHDPFVRDVIRRVQEEGTLWLSGTQWRGCAAMRISVVNWSTTDPDVDRSADAILSCYEAALEAASSARSASGDDAR